MLWFISEDRKTNLVLPPAPLNTEESKSSDTLMVDTYTGNITSLEKEAKIAIIHPGRIGPIRLNLTITPGNSQLASATTKVKFTILGTIRGLKEAAKTYVEKLGLKATKIYVTEKSL